MALAKLSKCDRHVVAGARWKSARPTKVMNPKILISLVLLVPMVAMPVNTVTNVAVGFAHSLFVESDGSLWAMGAGSSNNTNRPEQIIPAGVVAVAAGDNHDLFIKSDGSLWAM